MRIAIVGLANCGKSSVFSALTGADADVSAQPFTTRECQSAPALAPSPSGHSLVFIDTPGLCRGASLGQGLGTEFLQEIAEVDVVLQVVRLFGRGLHTVAHPEGDIDAFRDARIVDDELAMSDAAYIKRWLSEGGGDDPAGEQLYGRAEALRSILSAVEHGQMARGMGLTAQELRELTGMDILTSKPLILLANIDEEDLFDDAPMPFPEELTTKAGISNTPVIVACAKLEAEAASLTDVEDPARARGPGMVEELTGRERMLTRVLDVCEDIGLFS